MGGLMEIVRCVSCDGYGWFEDEAGAPDCNWCGGVGYIYRDENGVDRHIPASDYPVVAERLEQLEIERLREIGYTGAAKRPWEQAVRGQPKPTDET
ncbi:MAG TPA: hypothetical protein VHO69_08980 [Phototrophicaceae bacterium]|nr:hypothetical protein [Phototrophicaceae bacterium]